VKILHIYKDYPPILGGIENHVQLLAQGQAARGHDVTVLVTNPAQSTHGFPAGLQTIVAPENGVTVIRAGRLATVASTPLSVALPWQLLHLRPDVVHLHYPYPVGEVCQWLLRRGQVTVLSYHADIVRQASILRFYKPLLQRVLRWVNAIVIGSPPMRGGAFLGEHQNKLHLVPYGIPLAHFRAVPADADLARLRTRIDAAFPPPDATPASDTKRADSASPDLSVTSPPHLPISPSPLLLFVGRLRYYKGLDTLIRALPSLPARLVVVGIGPMETEWKALAERVGVTDRIAWLGEAPDADLPALYHLAELFVLPASHPSEAFGLVQVEAMAAGVPSVCTELGTGTSYVNQDGITGRVVPPRDPDALAGAIHALLADPTRRAAMGAAAQARVAAEFDLDVMVGRMLTLYEAVAPGV
jgi:glycosyltransferase involved in cell wall biosynthesis